MRPAAGEPLIWSLANARSLALDRARVMAILNVTPDSFSDGGGLPTPDAAADAAERATADGADILDLGGESTRPGSSPVSAAEQMARVLPALRAIRARGVKTAISIDTTLADVAEAALDEGADAVNDQSAGRDDDRMFEVVRRAGAGIVLMHRLRPPRDDTYSDLHAAPPVYEGGVTAAVAAFLRERTAAAIHAGIAPHRIALDPGHGFGKTVEQNLRLIADSEVFVGIGGPLVVGASRKSFLGKLGGIQEPAARLAPSLAAAVALRLLGAHIVRVHDVGEHVSALRIADAVVAARAGRQGA